MKLNFEQSDIQAWLNYLSTFAPVKIVKDLDRVKKVLQRLKTFSVPTIISVAGTNGKGSVVHALEKIYSSQGYKVGAFTSPALLCVSEQIRINEKPIEKNKLCDIFFDIECKRKDVQLTMFEFLTLAAIYYFEKNNLDIWILEVGIGGRLDAVNAIDADISIITSISYDHQELLGNSLVDIAKEKAGIMRSDKPVILAETHMQSNLIKMAKEINAQSFAAQRNYFYSVNDNVLNWRDENNQFSNIPVKEILPSNLAAAIKAVSVLETKLPVSKNILVDTLGAIRVLGRHNVHQFSSKIIILDVAHNINSILELKKFIESHFAGKKIRAVFSVFTSKPIINILHIMKPIVCSWHLAPVLNKRGCSLTQLQEAFQIAQISSVSFYSSISIAYQRVFEKMQQGEILLAFGSSAVIGEVMTNHKDMFSLPSH